MAGRTRSAAKAVPPVSSAKAVTRAKASSTASLSPAQSAPIRLFDTSSAWETWLAQNYQQETGLWLQIAKKNSPTPSVTYDQALDAALCYGWIDGQRKSHDDHYFIQRFTPRRKRSIWSQRNVNKVAVLIESGRMKPSGQAEVDAAKADGRWEKAYGGSSTIGVPDDFEAALKQNTEALRFFDALNKTQKYPFLWRIETTRRPETRKRKIVQFVEMLEKHETL